MERVQTVIYLIRALALLMVVTVASVPAQSGATAASITGTVTDEQGGAIVGANITVKNVETNFTRETSADERGSFTVTQLSPGDYELTIVADGFATRTSTVTIVLGTTTLLDFKMKPGQASEIIVVSASDAVEEGKTESSVNNDSSRIAGLPINRRNFLDFSLTSPRVTRDRTPQQGVAATSGLSFNGQPARNNNITIDGLDNNDTGPGSVRSTFSQDAVQEFQVVSDSYSAEFGRALGGVVNIVTRGGSNEYHGTLFGLVRNEALAARNAFSPIDPEFKQYQFGATLGGPVKKDKAFFFTSFERLSVKQNNIVTISDATVASVRSQGFALNNGPIPFGLGTTAFLARGDARVTNNDTIYVRYNYGGTFNGAGEPYGALIADTNSGLQVLRDNAVAVSNTLISPGLNLVNETRFLYSRRDQTVDPSGAGPQVNIVAPEGLVVFGRATLLPQPRKFRTYQIVNNVSLSRGAHQIKFGVDFIYVSTPVLSVPIFGGGFAFFPSIDFAAALGNPAFPVISGPQAFNPALRTPEQRAFLTVLAAVLPTMLDNFPAGVPLADLPLPAAFSQGFLKKDAPGNDNPSKLFSVFLQDEIKLRANLLLKAGVRYDLNRVRYIDSNNGNIAPRIALLYRPKRIEKLSARAAYGLFFAAPIFGPATVAETSRAGDLVVPVIPFPFSTLFYSLPGRRLPEGETLPAGVPFIAQLSLGFQNQPGMRASYSQQINTGIDYVLGQNVLSITYDFVRGIKILSQRNINPIVRPIPGDAVNSAITGRLDPRRGDIFEFSAAYDSYYHGVTLSLNRRLSNRIGLLASYTFSKAIDNFIDIRNELLQSVDPLNPRGERGLSLQDVRSRFIASGTWELGYTQHPILKDFQLGFIVNLESGRPFNLLAGVDLNQNGDNPPGDRPLMGGVPIGRNSGISPGFANVDMRLTRTFRIKERVKIEGFAEAFNLFNRVNISEVNTIFPPDARGNFQLPPRDGGRFIATADRFRGAFAPRQFQLGVRVTF